MAHPLSRRGFLQAGLAAALAACDGSPGPDPAAARLTARPATPTESPTTGLVEPLGLSGARDGILYVPAAYDPATPAPLFVALHGAGGSGHDWSVYTERAEANRMILLATDSRYASWDLRFGAFGPDVEFLDEALALVFRRCAVDPAHIALAGFSDGASYALSLGVSNGDLFTHLIGYSPGFLAAIGPIVGKPRVFISHGTADRILPVSESRGVIVPAFEDEGYDVTYHEFAGGHQVPSAVSDVAMEWFL